MALKVGLPIIYVTTHNFFLTFVWYTPVEKNTHLSNSLKNNTRFNFLRGLILSRGHISPHLDLCWPWTYFIQWYWFFPHFVTWSTLVILMAKMLLQINFKIVNLGGVFRFYFFMSYLESCSIVETGGQLRSRVSWPHNKHRINVILILVNGLWRWLNIE